MTEMNQNGYKISYKNFESILDICMDSKDEHVINVVGNILNKSYKNLNAGGQLMLTLSADDFIDLRKAIYSMPYRYAAFAGNILNHNLQSNTPQNMVNKNNQNIR